MNAPDESKPSEDEGLPNPAEPDEDSPLGDTSEHAGESEGGGEGGSEGDAPVRPGEGEGGESAPQPQSEKLANRRVV